MVSLYKTHGAMCTSMSKPSMGITYTSPATMSMLQASSVVQWPVPTTEADRARIREAQALWNGGGGGGNTRANDVGRVEPPAPATGTDLGLEVRASSSSSSSSSSHNSRTSEPEDLLQYPAARALQVLGYPPDDIAQAVRFLKRRGEAICAERLLDLVTEPEENGLVLNSTEEPSLIEEDCGPESGAESESDNPRTSSSEVEETAQQMMDSSLNLEGASGFSEDGISEGESAVEHFKVDTSSCGTSENAPKSPQPSTAIASLLEENDRLKMTTTCKICLGADVDTLFLPCRHLVCCESCANSVKDCPVCRRHILGTVKTYLA